MHTHLLLLLLIVLILARKVKVTIEREGGNGGPVRSRAGPLPRWYVSILPTHEGMPSNFKYQSAILTH